jgi:anthranilate synthase component 2
MLLVLDNYDSFTYNLVQYLGELGERPVVRRNDEISVDDIGDLGVTRMVISPGPCTPSDAGISVAAIRKWGSTIPALMHGKTSRVTHDGRGLFKGLPAPLQVMRYHSLVIESSSLPAELEVIARGVEDTEEIHAVKHRSHPVWGVQFHPESIMTQNGRDILQNFLRLAA